jgi:murein DD-endopeptidase MepM/ murein hydrolase activator NlpD
MPILDFPPSPSVGQIYENETSGTYRWNGYAWDRVNAYVVPIGIPDGGIIMWSGSIAAIPPSFVLCDGTNGTPDLRDRFIVGAGSTYAPLATGGSANSAVVSHNHGGTVSGGATYSRISGIGTYDRPGGAATGGTIPVPTSGRSQIVYTSGGGSDYYHWGIDLVAESATTSGGSLTITSAGEDGANKNLPPYFALAFIMKVAA